MNMNLQFFGGRGSGGEKSGGGSGKSGEAKTGGSGSLKSIENPSDLKKVLLMK